MNGSSRGRRTLIAVLLSTKLDLSKKVFDKVQDVEYNEIFSLVLVLKSVQIMLAIAAFYDYETSDQVATKPRRSSRVRSAPERYSNHILEVMLLDHDELANYKEAMMSPDSAKWFEAMKSEI